MTSIKKELFAVGKTAPFHNLLQQLSLWGWSIHHVETAQEAITALSTSTYSISLSALEMDAFSNLFDTQAALHDTYWVILITPDVLHDKNSCQLIYDACYAYQTFPINTKKVNMLLEAALDMASLHAAPPIPMLPCPDENYRLIGESNMMRKHYRTIHKVAGADAPVLITGESGTGKELTARAIHAQSSRRHGPFNVVNCGALPHGLIQSELFGHEKGAFTGANQRKIGIIESSQGGTLFLDEIGDLPLGMQVNLLRFLESLKIYRVGGLQEIPVDVRFLAATHVDLEAAVERGEFREDLYHRLNVLQIRTPALREHPEDIEPLTHFFFHKFSAEKPSWVRGFSHDCAVVMRQHSWPGNIRELLNRVRRAMVMCERRLIRPSDMGLERRHDHCRDAVSLQQVRDRAESAAIKAALARNNHKVVPAARELGISRVTLYRLLEKHCIDKDSSLAEQKLSEPSGTRYIQVTSS